MKRPKYVVQAPLHAVEVREETALHRPQRVQLLLGVIQLQLQLDLSYESYRQEDTPERDFMFWLEELLSNGFHVRDGHLRVTLELIPPVRLEEDPP